MNEQEKMLAGLAHQPAKRELSALRLQCKELLYEFNYLTRPSDKDKKAQLLTALLGHSGVNPHINSPFACDYGRFIHVGDNFFANYNCVILDNGGVNIGNDVMFAPNVSLYTVGHPLDAELRNQAWEHAKPITIGNNVWIGGNVVILGGVTIGDNVVIGAGSVVTKDIPSHHLAFGNPCRVIRPITEKDRDLYLKTYFKHV